MIDSVQQFKSECFRHFMDEAEKLKKEYPDNIVDEALKEAGQEAAEEEMM